MRWCLLAAWLSAALIVSAVALVLVVLIGLTPPAKNGARNSAEQCEEQCIYTYTCTIMSIVSCSVKRNAHCCSEQSQPLQVISANAVHSDQYCVQAMATTQWCLR
eukprot:13880-Heterococcus_DN1.PRE.1